MAAETAMAREWRERYAAGTERRADMTPDPDVPGLYWPHPDNPATP